MLRIIESTSLVRGLKALGIVLVAWLGALISAAPSALAASTAQADWTVIELHPAGASDSWIEEGRGSSQVGSAIFGGSIRAILWSGSSGSSVDLTPAGTSSAQALCVDGIQQFGFSVVGGALHASMWSGTAASWVGMNPTGASESIVSSSGSGQQCGRATIAGIRQAGLWHNGSAASWMSLHPAGASDSWAYSTNGVQQGGAAVFGGVQHAGIWNGSAASWVDLSGGLISDIHELDSNQQGGFAYIGARPHACVWTGSAESRIDLNGDLFESQVYGVGEGLQVGTGSWSWSQIPNYAFLWSGTPESRVDLHPYLPFPSVRSWAKSVWQHNGAIYIAGEAVNSTTGRRQAVLWVKASPPDPDTDGDGLLDVDEIGAYGTDPNDPDTDDDGLLDGTEVDMAQGSGCPNPLSLDSDGDTLADGAEVALGTSACDPDSDGDGIPDNIDPLPTNPEGTAGYLESTLRTLCDVIQAAPLSEFDAPNANAARGRRNAMCNKVMAAANAVAAQDFVSAIDGLTSLLDKLDGAPNSPDWMLAGQLRDDVLAALIQAITVLYFM
jgi:hypothetical protein